MIHAYDRESLDTAMDSLGDMMEYAVQDIGVPAEEFYQWFLTSSFAERFGRGETAVVNGMSGIELAREVIWSARQELVETPQTLHTEKCPACWAGWAVAYYQWDCARPFRTIDNAIPFCSIIEMYHPYHEMDVTRFADAMNQRMDHYFSASRIGRLRKYADLTQRELSEASGVPLRTVQQYEQGQKDIGKAAAETVMRLAAAMHCEPEALLQAGPATCE